MFEAQNHLPRSVCSVAARLDGLPDLTAMLGIPKEQYTSEVHLCPGPGTGYTDSTAVYRIYRGIYRLPTEATHSVSVHLPKSFGTQLYPIERWRNEISRIRDYPKTEGKTIVCDIKVLLFRACASSLEAA